MTAVVKRRRFFSTCVNWPSDLMDAKDFLDSEAEEIDRATFLGLVLPSQMGRLERGLGYAVTSRDEGIAMADDWHVRYFREPQSGIPFFVHSATEHVFADPGEIRDLQNRLMTPDPEQARRRSLLVIQHPGRLKTSSRDADPFDEMIDELIAHDGSILVIDDPASLDLGLHDRNLLMRALVAATLRGQEAGLVWDTDTRSPAPAGWAGMCSEGFADLPAGAGAILDHLAKNDAWEISLRRPRAELTATRDQREPSFEC